jgi:hypothetical protein
MPIKALNGCVDVNAERSGLFSVELCTAAHLRVVAVDAVIWH